MSAEWRSIKKELPPNDPEWSHNYGFWRSVPVLVWSGKVQHAYLRQDSDDDRKLWWVLVGRDGYELDEPITHWMPLPEAPPHGGRCEGCGAQAERVVNCTLGLPGCIYEETP
jgi:hypothetical protein